MAHEEVSTEISQPPWRFQRRPDMTAARAQIVAIRRPHRSSNMEDLVVSSAVGLQKSRLPGSRGCNHSSFGDHGCRGLRIWSVNPLLGL